MKNGIKHLVGQRVTGVVAARGHGNTRDQVFLLLEGGRRFELHGENFSCASGLDSAAGIFEYIRDGGGKVTQAYGLDDTQVAEAIVATTREVRRGSAAVTMQVRAVESTERLLARDLDAWKAAKAAVAKARKA